ncbi:MAG: OsmC family protein [Anaeromyxobacter sp.]
MPFEVETRNIHGRVTTVGSAGGHTLVIDRPAAAGGGGLGFNGGELLHLAVAGCISNDLFREAAAAGLALETVRVVVRGDFAGQPAVSTGITYEVEVSGRAEAARLQALIEHVDAIAEIPGSLRRGTTVLLAAARVRALPEGAAPAP